MQAIRSEQVFTLVNTRAHIIALMADPAVPPLAKQVGCLLWAITETWEHGESRSIPFAVIAERIAWEKADGSIAHPHRDSIKTAVSALEAAGYISVDRSGCGRHKPAKIKMRRRKIMDPFTTDPSGDFRVWTAAQMETHAEKAGCGDPPSDGKQGVETPLTEKGGCGDPAFERKEGVETPPVKETFFRRSTSSGEVDLQELPPLADGSAAASGTSSSSGPEEQDPWAESTDQTDRQSQEEAWTWSRLQTAANVTAMLVALSVDQAREDLSARKQREITKGLEPLMDSHPLPAVVWGLGYWAADRRLGNANLLTEIMERYLTGWEIDVDALADGSPVEALAFGYESGEQHREERLAKVVA